VAACNGHAIAGGGVMLCSADVRYAARGKGRIGVPELLVGVPFPLIALQITKFVVRPDRLQEVVYTGQTYDVESAIELGFCEKSFEPDELADKACARAQELAEIPTESFRFTKKAMRSDLENLLSLRAESMDAEVIRLWCSDEVREAVEKYLEETLGAQPRIAGVF
jgi:enoyl-CoA hydratase